MIFMKGASKEILEEGRPNYSAGHCINFALNKLYDDKTKRPTEEAVKNLTYEEIIGALLLARDAIESDYLPDDIMTQLDTLSDQTGDSRNQIIRDAIEQYLKTKEKS